MSIMFLSRLSDTPISQLSVTEVLTTLQENEVALSSLYLDGCIDGT